MSAETAPTVTESTAEIVATKAMVTAYSKVTTLTGKLGQAIDDYRLLCKTEALSKHWTKKQLTLAIISSGCSDPARASEFATFVFPNSHDARPVLDEIMQYNAQQTDPKDRIEKNAILKVSRAKGTDADPIPTLDDLLEEKKQKALGNGNKRKAAGKTDQVDHKVTGKSEKTGDELDAELGTLIAVALNFAKANGYDQTDFNAILSEWADKILPEETEEEQADGEPEEETLAEGAVE